MHATRFTNGENRLVIPRRRAAGAAGVTTLNGRGLAGERAGHATRLSKRQATRTGDRAITRGAPRRVGALLALLLTTLIALQPVALAYGMELEAQTPADDEERDVAEAQDEAAPEKGDTPEEAHPPRDGADTSEANARGDETPAPKDAAKEHVEANAHAEESEASEEPDNDGAHATSGISVLDEARAGTTASGTPDTPRDRESATTTKRLQSSGASTTGQERAPVHATNTAAAGTSSAPIASTTDDGVSAESQASVGASESEIATPTPAVSATTTASSSAAASGGGGTETQTRDEEDAAQAARREADAGATTTSTSTPAAAKAASSSALASSTAATSGASSTMDAQGGVAVAQTPQSRYVFGDGDCTRVEDGQYYCFSEEAPSAAALPPASGEPVVRTDEDGDKEIYYVAGNDTTRITDNRVDDFAPSYDPVSGRIVWHAMLADRLQIMLHDLTTGVTTQLTDASYNNSNPHVFGSSVIWQGWRDGNWEIFFIQDVTREADDIERLTHNDAHDMFPAIYDDYLTWQMRSGERWHVVLYDRSDGTYSYIEKEGDGQYENPRFVLLLDSRDVSGEVDIVGYDVASGERVPLNAPRSAPSDPVTPADESQEAVPAPVVSASSTKQGERRDSGEA